MKKYLIINADDFGLHPQVDRGIEKVCQGGVVRSLSFAVNTESFEEALRCLKRCQDVSVGIHLNITDGKPVSKNPNLDFLLDESGSFRGSHIQAALSVLSNANRIAEIKIEFEKQIKKLLDHGVKPSHLDSHGHLHLLPSLSEMIASLTRRFRIPFVRVAKEKVLFRSLHWKAWILSVLSKRAAARFGRSHVRTVNNSFSIGNSGRMTKGKLLKIIPKVGEGVTELAVHPGMDDASIAQRFKWNYSWEEELRALADWEIREAIIRHDITLINFNEIPRGVFNGF